MDQAPYQILLVENDKDDYHYVCELVSRALPEGSKVDWVDRYDDALPAIACSRHDAVLVDYRLGSRSGLDLVREALARGCNMPLILLTGQDHRAVDHEAMEAGAAGFLVKGRTDAETLERSLRYAIRHKRVEDQLRLARAEAEAASRAKSTVLAHISHEIRTPMNGVVGIAELLMQTPLDALQQEYASTIRTSAQALLAVINDVLDHSRIEAGRVTLEAVPFDPGRVVEEVVDLLAPLAHQKGLQLASQLPSESPIRLVADPVRLRQVLTNLVGNAVKFTESGEVNVRAALVGETGSRVRLRIAVDDTGPGIPAHRHASIFDSFTQVGDGVNGRYGGTGLGLAISRQLVGLMGGRIGLESTPGVGSTFWLEVSLPRARDADPAWTGPPLPAGHHILVAESGTTVRRILTEYLRSWSFRVTEARDARSALDALRRPPGGVPFALALVDVHLSGSEGASLAREIREDPALAGMRLVSMYRLGPGAGPPDRIEQGLFDASLPKPVRRSQLLNVLLAQLAPSEEVHRGPERPLPAPSLADRALHVLVADDSDTNRRVARMMLDRWGCRVDAAVNGREAVERAQQTSYDAILMDVQMPEMDGFQATEAIRAWEQGTGRHTPIIALTAHAQDEHRRRCLDSGMDAFLRKPIVPQELIDLLSAWSSAAPQLRATDAPASNPERALWASRLEELCADDVQLRNEIVGNFLEEAERGVRALEVALVQQDPSLVGREAHRLKGSCLTLGVETMARACWGLEALGNRAELATASALLAQLRMDFHRVRAEMLLLLAETPVIAAEPA